MSAPSPASMPRRLETGPRYPFITVRKYAADNEYSLRTRCTDEMRAKGLHPDRLLEFFSECYRQGVEKTIKEWVHLEIE